jgi:hypothetical protein
MRFLGLFLLLCVACDDGSADGDGAVDGGPPVCDEPDTECPAEQPIGGAPCEGTLSCDYDQGRSFGVWTYTCESSAWVAGDAPCSELPGGGCAPPPLAERCREPFSGTLDGASVQIGPAAATTFRPFEDGEMATAVRGGQGAFMIEVALQLEGEGTEALQCISVDLDLSYGETGSAPYATDTEVHCGSTRRLFVVLPGDLVCEPSPAAITLDVTVSGVGSTSVDLTLDTDMTCLG